jgi:hypothetical protein
MEERAVIHFFTLLGMKAKAIHIELERVSSPEALARRQWGSGGDAFTKGEWIRLTYSGPEDS